MHLFTEYVNPHLGRLLEAINMDKRFVRGEGCYLWDSEGRRYLDFVAAYGALPFGFNPPEIWEALRAVELTGEPSFVQPSALQAAGELARRLIEVAPEGLRYVTFANSGAEAVEAAIKAVRAATGRMGIISCENSFHGKTLGALSATNRRAYQDAFGAPIPGFAKVPYGDLDALERLLAAHPDEFAGFIVEPIQGEGGIVEPPPGYLAAAKALCRRYGVFFILDEIQTGLGRTGRLFACEEEGVTPDVMVLAKALGGGLVPIGAMLCTEEVYTEEFAMKHSSTFAGNTLAARAGLRSLELLTRDDGALVRQVAENGAFLKAGLEELQRRYPHVLRRVRGRGFMLGLEIGVDRSTYGRTCLLGVLAEQDNLTPILSSYLLNVCGLRVAPTLNGSAVIRIEPPLIATREQCQAAVVAVERMLIPLAEGNTAELVSHLLGVESRPQNLPAPVPKPLPEPSGDPGEGRIAFLVHPVDWRNYPEMDESFQVFSTAEIAEMADRFNDLLEPFVAGSCRVTAPGGRRVFVDFVVVPRTADQLMGMPHAQAVAEVRAALEIAKKRGAQLVGLGAYTSVVTRGGLHLRNPGVALTTGNSYTVVSAVEAMYLAVERLGTRLPEATVAVVGATGAIGRATAILLAEGVGRVVLIGNPARPEASRRRLLKVAGDIVAHLADLIREGYPFAPGTLGARLQEMGPLPEPVAEPGAWEALALALEQAGALRITTDIDAALPEADLVLTATSSAEDLVTPANLKFGAVVCDISRPPNVSRAVKEARPDVLVIDGGVVEVPGRPDLGWNFGFERGLAYACMAETMILGLMGHFQDTSLGADLNLPMIRQIRQWAEELGFRLAQLRSFDRPLSEAEWAQLMAARARVLSAAGDD
ncbi:aminotransferase class III-fold pyridoxal phosphate-dependent enzyme [Symbiobacterium thermophilum]|uniref:Putative class-III aminotransferase n=3 Tax=Symbiobacterium thermophilum TaxID=2734 RepID=Q67RE0_SYMTH|nr:aminotransferase class III-fold pyridoxal phosphate-dependent enzyme [Symbiobacterium thermophilum]BAD39753.1 putative class-III aminotransferase [Symbiobacterium thermophilum IAM 14863]